MMVGTVPTDGGSIAVGWRGRHPHADFPAFAFGIAYPQEASIFRKLTVSENIAAILELQV